MKKSQLVVTLLAALAFAGSACAPNPAGASSASSQGQVVETPSSAGYGPGSGAAAPAPTQDVSSDSTGYGSGSASVPTAVPGQSSGSQDLGGGGYGNAAGSSAAPTESSTPMSTLNVADNSQLGSILVDQGGMTLYAFMNDTPGAGTSACYDSCAGLWPALTATSPNVGAGLDASKLGSITRTDGTTQVTYNGWPLYLFAKDTKPGDTTGQGLKSIWYVIAPSGEPVK